MAIKGEITDKTAIIEEIALNEEHPTAVIAKKTHLEPAEVDIYVSNMKEEGLLEDDGLQDYVTLSKEGELAYKGGYEAWKKINSSPMQELVLQIKKIVNSQSRWNWTLAIATVVLAVVAVITLVRLFWVGDSGE